MQDKYASVFGFQLPCDEFRYLPISLIITFTLCQQNFRIDYDRIFEFDLPKISIDTLNPILRNCAVSRTNEFSYLCAFQKYHFVNIFCMFFILHKTQYHFVFIHVVGIPLHFEWMNEYSLSINSINLSLIFG